MKLEFIICDDNEYHLKEIDNTIESMKMKYDIHISSFISAKEMLEYIKNRERDTEKSLEIVLLDIELADGNGIEIGKQIKECYPEICLVFVTSYVEYAVKGYEAKAYRYLVKPITMESIEKIITDIINDEKKKKRLMVKDCEFEKMVPLEDILYIMAEDKYTFIYTETARYFENKSLQYYEDTLQMYGFYRTHRKYLVNMHHHKALKKGNVILSGEIEIPLSRRREAQYREELLRMMEKNLL